MGGALLACLCLAGPRITELLDATRGGLDVHTGELRLGKKTHAGINRHLELSEFLASELRAHIARIPAKLRDQYGADLPLFPSRTGRPLNASNIRNRLLTETVKRTNDRRAEAGKMLLPDHITPHTFRRTFASLCFFAGRDLRWVMGQLGHDDPRMTLAVYAQVLKRARIDYQLVWDLLRAPGEPETWPGGSDPKTGPTTPDALRIPPGTTGR
jgi:integrase